MAGLPGVRLLTSPEIGPGCGLGGMSIEGVDAQRLTDHLLEEHAIHVRPRFVREEFDCIRVTPNVFTTLGEVDLFARAIGAAVRHLS